MPTEKHRPKERMWVITENTLTFWLVVSAFIGFVIGKLL